MRRVPLRSFCTWSVITYVRTHACPCRYCMVGTWSRTWYRSLSLTLFLPLAHTFSRSLGLRGALVCVDGREKGRPHSRALRIAPSKAARRNVVGSWPPAPRPHRHGQLHRHHPSAPPIRCPLTPDATARHSPPPPPQPIGCSTMARSRSFSLSLSLADTYNMYVYVLIKQRNRRRSDIIL